MGNNLEARVNRLEQRAGMSGEGIKMVWIVDAVRAKDGKPVERKLLGVKIGDETVLRPARESEDEFLARVQAKELELLNAEQDQGHQAVAMFTIRVDEAVKQ